MLEAVVGAFGGFAQMLESTYMATHSSFFAMVGVAEQITALRKHIFASASVGVLALWRVLVKIWRRLTGRGSHRIEVNMSEFKKFQSSSPDTPGVSMWPLAVFLAAVLGGPYLMTKLIRAIASRQEPDQMRLSGHDAAMLANDDGDESVIDPAKLEFCRAVYDFVPQSDIELGFSKGEIIAILAKDENIEPAWWRGRVRDGRMGYFPSNYVELIKRNIK
ncbi:Peroxin 13, N-terminal region-domain-containing protein [Lipomyces arxii]|uniref:Peroxin 13, N-terminal region-domain-containing protein n=1 Tax=Lipomyces arxii TaxID=56418 RepID=UPI0034CE6739